MHTGFRWTCLLTLVVASLVAAPLVVLAQGTGLHDFGLRGTAKDRGPQASSALLSNQRLFPRAFAPVIPNLGLGQRAVFGPGVLATPSGALRLGHLASLPPAFSAALTREIRPTDAAILPFGERSREEILGIIAESGVQVLDIRPTNAFIATGLTPVAQAILSRYGVTPLGYTSGLFTAPDIGVSPMPTQAMAVDENLNLLATVFRGGDAVGVTDLISTLGGQLTGTSNNIVVFSMNIHTLRDSLAAGAWDGFHLRNLVERGIIVSADEDTSAGIEIGAFAGGRRPYVEVGIDASTQIIGITDSGLSLDATPLADSPAGANGFGTANPAGPTHRKVIGYTAAQDIAGAGAGVGDGLSCDFVSSGATHGHIVASIAAGNASELLSQVGTTICDVGGWRPATRVSTAAAGSPSSWTSGQSPPRARPRTR